MITKNFCFNFYYDQCLQYVIYQLKLSSSVKMECYFNNSKEDGKY